MSRGWEDPCLHWMISPSLPRARWPTAPSDTQTGLPQSCIISASHPSYQQQNDLCGRSRRPRGGSVGTIFSEDAGVEYVQVRKTIYLPAPYVVMFLERDLTPVNACSRLQGSIVNAESKSYFCPIINWLRVELTWNSRDAQTHPLPTA